MGNFECVMSVTLVLGATWGDEGKGKVVDFLSQNAHFVIRFNGGNNAGHTVVNKYGTFAMHLIPSGIFHKRAVSFITNGVVLDIEVLSEELKNLEKAGIKTKNRFFISPRCHIIMPYHKLLDKAYEEAKEDKKTGTTGRGIGPVFADKVSYNGIRLFDLLDKTVFVEKLQTQLKIKNKILQSFGIFPLSQKDIIPTYLKLREKIKPFIIEPYPFIQKAIQNKKNILLEGAQGVMLDTDWGTYPFVTASTIVSGGINHQAGIPPQQLKTIIGVAKAYTTRVGSGPFPTELLNSEGEKLRVAGNEFGTTTGRPRRCGWFDAEVLRFVKEVNGLTSLAITKIDILDSFKTIKICTGYTYKGKKIRYFQTDANLLAKVTPLYKTLEGWQTDTKGITKYNDLPRLAKQFIKEIEKQVAIPVSYISTGQKTSEIITV